MACTPLGTTLPNLGLCAPAVGETGWGPAMNANLAILDGLFTGPNDSLLGRKHTGLGAELKQLVAGGGIIIVPDVEQIVISATGGITGSSGLYTNRGLIGKNNAATPNTKYDWQTIGYSLFNPGTFSTKQFLNPGTLTTDLTTAGPAINGRDQAAVFPPSSWIYFYAISNGTLVNSIASLIAPPTGPTMPGGYTLWDFLGAVYFDASSHLVLTDIVGDYASITQVIVRSYALGSGAEQSFDISANIPPIHRGADLFLSANVGTLQQDIRVATGGRVALTANNGANVAVSIGGRVPLAAQTVFFIGNAGGAAGVTLKGYWLPN